MIAYLTPDSSVIVAALRERLKKSIEWYCSRRNGDRVKADIDGLLPKH